MKSLLPLIGYCIITTVVAAQTNPAAQALPYTQNFGTSTFTAMPVGMAAWNGLDGSAVSTQALAEATTPSGDAGLTGVAVAQTTAGTYGYAVSSNAKAYIQTGSDAVNGVNQLCLAVNCTGYGSIVVKYDIEIVSAQPKTIGVVLQYRIGTTGAWTTFAGTKNPFSQAAGTTGSKGTASVSLPNTVNSQANLQLRWATWRGTETGNSSGLDIDNINITGTAVAVPTVATTVISAITNIAANSGGSISNGGGGNSAVTVKGACWSLYTAPDPDISLATKTSNGTGTGSYASALTGLAGETRYKVKAYATNQTGTGYGTAIDFYTISNPATTAVTNFKANTTELTQITLTWTAATFPASGASSTGYVIIVRQAATPAFPSGSNGKDPNTLVFAAGTSLAAVISPGTATSYIHSSLAANTKYLYQIIPFTWNGSASATYNYRTTSAPTATGYTPSSGSTITAVAGSEAALVSSIINTATITTTSNTLSTQVWQFIIRDGGGANDADNLATIVNGVTFNQSAGNSMANFSNAIYNAALFNGATLVNNAPVITATQIKFTGLTITAGDFSNLTISLRLTVKANTNAGSPTGVNADGNDFGFQLGSADVTASAKGSQFAGFTTINSADAKNVYAVVATKLTFVQQPADNITNNSFTPVVSVQSIDAGGNRDIGLAGNVTVTAAGSALTGSPVNAALSNGLASFTGATDLKFSTAGNPVTITASKTGVTPVVSNSFAITVPGLAVYRTKGSGGWNQVSPVVWEMSTNNGVSWSDVVSPGLIPGYQSSFINIQPGNTVTATNDITIDETTVASGGQLTINAGVTVTLNNGAATPDLNVLGIIVNAGGTAVKQGQIGFTAGATVIFRNGSWYKNTDQYAVVPADANTTWEAASTLEFTGNYSTSPALSATETYGNIIWNAQAQAGTVNLNGALKNIAGYFDLKSTNGQYLQLASAAGATVNVLGDFIIEGGLLQFSNNTGSTANGDHILNLYGAYTQTGGSFEAFTDAGRSLALNFNGTGELFTQTAGSFNTAQINISISANADVTLMSNMGLSAGRSLTVNGTFITGSQQVTGSGSVTVNNTLITANSGGLIGNNTAAIANGVILNALTKTVLIKYNGTTAQLLSARTDYNNVTVTGNSTKTMDGDVTVADSFFIDNGDVNINGHTLTLNGTIEGGGDLTGSNTSNLTIGGTGGNAGTLSFTVGNELLNVFKMNRAGTGAKVLLGTDVITDSLDLTNGIIATDINLLTVTDGTAISNYSAASYVATSDVNGNTIDTSLTDAGFRIDNVGGSTDTYFPVGPDFNSYNRLMINNAAGPDYFTVIVSKGDIGNTIRPVTERIWTVRDGNPGANNADMRLYFTKRDWAGTVQDEIEQGFNYGDVRLAAKPDSGFSNYSPLADTKDYSNNSNYPYGSEIYAEYTRANNSGNGIQLFEKFTALNLGEFVLAAPDMEFTAVEVNGKVEVKWTTTTATVKPVFYEVEKSVDGTRFTRQYRTAAVANGILRHTYGWVDDNPLTGNNFYRVRTIDKDGSDSYTGVINIKIVAGKQDINVYPNPVINKLLNIRLTHLPEGTYTTALINSEGKMVFCKKAQHPGGNALLKIQLPPALAKGLYMLTMSNEKRLFSKLLLVAD